MVARELRSRARPREGGGAAAGAGAARAGAESPTSARRAAAAADRRQRAALAAERAREVEDSPRVLRDKCRRLARALRDAKHLVVYTGAGISTAADIPDYRGPRGVWTRLRAGERAPRVDPAAARPTYTHMALAALLARGDLKFLVSQNCDGLHLRAGVPRRALAELHGDMFAERCAACRAVYLRAFDTTERTARHRHGTRRLCHACGAELTDTIVHFGERGRARWPLNWAAALRHAARADVVLCLGSSLKVLRRYPRLWRMHSPPHARPRLYIVNLQWTPKDAVAALKINARCDDVMRAVARRLRLRVPRYRRAADPLLAHAEPLAPPEAHTTRRAPLPAPTAAGEDEDEDGGSCYEDDGGSATATDSDEEVPLRRLADRLRGASAAPAPPALRAFRVTLQCGDATILLRAEHAPAAPAPAPPGAASALRRVRLPRARPAPAPPPAPPPPPAPAPECGSRLRRLLEPQPGRADDRELEVDSKLELELKLEPKLEFEAKTEPKLEFESKPSPKLESEPAGADEESGARALAAAIIARAVLLCRGQLYPGLHTILAAPAPAPECAWCWRARGARRCLWYGPPRLTPPAARARRRGRLLCACCGPAAPRAPAPDDTAGWYGKGYRKGRRRLR